MKLAPAIEEFIQYKRALGYLYVGPANILKAFLRKTGDLELDALTSRHCEVFLPSKGGEVTSSWFHKHTGLSQFFRFAANHGYMQHRVLPTSMPARPPRFIPYIYSIEDIRRLLGVPDSHYPRTSPMSPDTMRTFILVLYGTGLRVGEVSRLTHANADFRNATLLVRETKFEKSRLVPIGKDLVGILRLYRLRHRPGIGYQRPPTLLATKIGMMIRNDHADHQFDWLRREAGVLRFDNARYQPRLHDFRHTFAVTRLLTWYREGKDVQRMLPLLSTYLGHCSVEETSEYLQMTRELLKEANRCFERYAFTEVHNG
ncbi:MAG TPA: tyrosine-type recombinase/integrase [Terriglobia bacterium]|nr:tyrosine-type recombinase/integrase [Terriglobia bacterium]